MIEKKSKIYVAGHKGLVGSAIIRALHEKGYHNIVYRSKKQLDLKDKKKVFNFLKKEKPKFIFLAAAKVGGINYNNKYKADFIYENLSIQTNVISSAYENNIKDLIFLGSSCVYPKYCPQPIKERYLLTGSLEETNDAYAIAKIAGIKMCESFNEQYKTNYKCLMPTNTFGPNDNYDLANSHFVPALIRKLHNIKKNNLKELKIWGNGKPKREIIFVDDIAEACVYFMNKRTNDTLINIGTGRDYSISAYAKMFNDIIIPDRKLKFIFDSSKPNGTPRKVLDVSLASKYGWKAKIKIREAILETYKSYLKNEDKR